MNAAVLYVPSFGTGIEPVQTGGAVQSSALLAGNGPYSDALTVAGWLSRPLTITESVSAVPGSTLVELTAVLTVGWTSTRTCSFGSVHGVTAPMWAAVSATVSLKT